MFPSLDEGPGINIAGSSRDSDYYERSRNPPESAPLLGTAGPSRSSEDDPTTISTHRRNLKFENSSLRRRVTYHSSDESYLFDLIMEKVKSTRFSHFVDRFAVESEPGLTNAQLMLNNHDLRPVEVERRQWGPWNFVGFWVADSFNIVRILTSYA